MRKYLPLLVLVCLLVLSGCGSKESTKDTENVLTIGAILPLTGPASIWGEGLQGGMDLAREQLAEKGITLKIIYEDSAAEPAKGVSAYRKLVDVDNVDVIFSALSRISVPLVPLADEDKMPLVMTFVAAEGVADGSPYAFRYFPSASYYVDAHFEGMTSEEYGKIATLYVNDEYGVSIRNAIRRLAEEKGIEVITEETFVGGTTDFRVELTKIKEKEPQALMFIGVTPPEISNALKQVKELQLDVDVFEASMLLSVAAIRDVSGEAAEGVLTNAFPFTLEKTGESFAAEYQEAHGKDPFIASALGHDMVSLIGQVSTIEGMSRETIADNILALGTVDSLNGEIVIQPNGEINQKMHSVRVVDGDIVEV